MTVIQQVVRDFLAARRAYGTPSRRRSSGVRSSGPVERLEGRTLLSGETVTAALGSVPLPVGAQFKVVYRATVDGPLTKGIGTVYNQGSVSGTNFTTVKTDDADPTATAVDRAPAVAGVYVRSSGCSPSFLTSLATAGLGDATFGYLVPAGANQLASVPWSNIDRVSVKFTETVSVAADDLQLLGAAGGTVALNAGSFTYNSAPAVSTATWAMTTGVALDKLRLVLDSAAATGVNQSGTGGGRLDGEWVDGTAAYNSGDGVAGGDFSFRLNVAAGDVNGDGVVNTTDGVIVRAGLSPAAYDPRRDVNADGAVNVTDFNVGRALIGSKLPAADPAGTAGGGWVAATTPTLPNPAGSAATTVAAKINDVLVVDVDADGQVDPGDTVEYTLTVTNGGGAAATGLSFTTALDSRMTLVGGSVKSSPVLADTVDTSALGYTENAATAAVLPNLLVADPDGTLTGATVGVTGWVNGQDVLSFTPLAGINGVYNASAGTIAFTGPATVADYQTVLRSVAYSNASESPAVTARTLGVSAGDGSSTSNSASRSISVTAVNDAPTLTALEGTSLAYNQNTGPLAATSAITVGDVDSANLTGATVSISSGYVNGQDALSFTNQLGITGSFNATTGVLTLSGSTTLANYQGALRAVQFANTTGSTTSKTLSFQVNDGSGANNLSTPVATRAVAVNLAPTVAGESFNAVGNTPLLLGIAQGSTAAAVVSGSVLSNDADPAPSSNPITINGTGTPSSGTVSMNSDGTFTYTPAAGFTGAATFTYTARDASGAISQPATVTINVGAMVWYVDNSGSNGDGRATTPFNTLANAVAASAAGEVIFVNTGSGNTTAGITLKANQQLIGCGVALSVDPDGAGSLTAISLLGAGTAPTLTRSAAGTAGVTLSNAGGNVNTIRGLTIGTTTGGAIFGSGFGTLNADTVAINNAGNNRTGQILDLTTGAVNATFTNLSTTSATTGLNLVGLTGSLAASAGTISGVGGTDVNVGAGTAGVTYGGSVTNTAGNSVVVSGHTGGTLAFNGAISDAGAGISLTNNAGSTINFTGGLSLSTTTNAAFTATGGGTISVTGTNTITTTGTAVNVANMTIGAGGMTFSSVSTSGAANGVLLDTVGAGAFTASGGSIVNATTRGVDVNGGTGNVTYAGTVSTSGGAARAVEVTGHTGGTVTFNGGITDTTTGINLTGNTGGTITFAAGLNISTGANTAFNATGGGTVNATQNNTTIVNTLATTTGRAVNVDSVTAALTLRSVSASGGSTTAVFLKNTGAGGSFTVTGTASTAGSGGTINAISGADGASRSAAATAGTGIYMENVSNVSLSNMSLTGAFTNFGIRGENVNNFTLRDSALTGTFGTDEGIDEGAIRFGTENNVTVSGLKGTALFEGNTIGGGYENNLSVYLYLADTLNMTVQDSANDQAVFNANSLLFGDDALIVESGGTGSNLTLTVNGVAFNAAGGDQLQTNQIGVTTQTLAITNNQFLNTHGDIVSGGGGVWLLGGDTSTTSNITVNYTFSGNTIKGAQGDALRAIFTGFAATINGVILNNTIGTNNGVFETNTNGGSTNGGNGTDVGHAKAAGTGNINYAVRIEGNQIFDVKNGNGGINLTAGGTGAAGISLLEATVKNNVVGDVGPDLLSGLYAIVGGGGATDDAVMGLNVTGNTFRAGTASGDAAIFLDQLGSNSAAHYNIPGYAVNASTGHGEGRSAGTASAALYNFWATPATGGAGTNTLVNGPFPTYSPNKVTAGNTFGITNSALGLAVPLMAASGGVSALNPTPATTLRLSDLNMIKDAAIRRWQQAGISAKQLAALKAVSFQVADLPGQTLGLSSGTNKVTIDANAAGHGWYVDATPTDDKEFATVFSKTRIYAKPTAAPAGRMDLLTAVMHEFGHVLGFGHTPGREGLMYDALTTGERRLPSLLGGAGL